MDSGIDLAGIQADHDLVAPLDENLEKVARGRAAFGSRHEIDAGGAAEVVLVPGGDLPPAGVVLLEISQPDQAERRHDRVAVVLEAHVLDVVEPLVGATLDRPGERVLVDPEPGPLPDL